MKLPRKKFLVFSAAAAALSSVAMLVVLLAADLILHARAEKSAGLNRRGYRGPVVSRKQPGELRVVMLGGSTVFGYGVAWNESIPFNLERELRGALGRSVSVVNLGYNNEGAYSFLPNLEDFAYLDYDAVVLYEGYNDLQGDAIVNRSVYRRNSAVFRLTGYFPILPLYLDEKVLMLRSGGSIDQAYTARQTPGAPTVFRAGLASRTSAGALEAVSSMAKALDSQLSKLANDDHAALRSPSELGCTEPFINYCESVAAATRWARSRGRAVVVGLQPMLVMPNVREMLTRQQAMLRAMLDRSFGSDRGVVMADLSQQLDLTSTDVTFDAMHLKPQANAAVAAALVGAVRTALSGAGIK